jgi:hypothetical protein
MHKHNPLTILILAIVLLTTIGCSSNENQRLAEMAERHSQRQAEQNNRMAELQHEVAEGSRRLVEADAQARQDFVAMNRDAQTERTEIGRQRDALEEERRNLAARRWRDPIIAATITNLGLLAACLLPLVLCWYLLRRPVEPADDQVVAEVLLEDLVARHPLLLLPNNQREAGAPDLDSTHILK